MFDPQLKKLVKAEIERQEMTLDLIPSENFASREVRQLTGSALMHKYAEGYPGRRYYPGNTHHDAIERLAQAYALQAFKLSPKAWRANVQPYSGSPANLAIYAALMEPGETLMGLSLAAGGHLTHGHRVSQSGRLYRSVQYGVDQRTGLLDYGAVSALARREKPKVIVSGLTAYPRRIDFNRFGAIAKSVSAYHVADISHIAGLVLAGVHPSPFPHADAVMTTTHKTLGGTRGAVIFVRQAIADAVDRAVFPGLQGGPHMNITAAHAQLFHETMQPAFKAYQRRIVANATALSRALKSHGAKLVTGGTDNHLMLLDVRPWGLDGLTAERLLEENRIIANRNSIPGDPSPFKPSGIRMGTPAITRRGMKESQMKLVAQYIFEVLVERKDRANEVRALCRKFSAKKYLKP